MKKIESICVYCSASDRVSDVYKQAAVQLGTELAARKFKMIYGGGNTGLMGLASNAAIKAGGYVVGYSPHHLAKRETPNHNISELYIVDSMHIRKQKMSQDADAFFVLPGGFGTLDEMFEIITWHQLELHDKPLIILNINGFWTDIKAHAERSIREHFVKEEHRSIFTFVDSIEEAFRALEEAPPEQLKSKLDLI